MESFSQPPQQEVKVGQDSNAIEGAPKKKSHVLRAGDRVRALVAAGLIGLGGGIATEDAHAGNFNLTPQQKVGLLGTVIGGVLQGQTPRTVIGNSVGILNPGIIMPTVIDISPDVQKNMDTAGFLFGNAPFFISSKKFPNETFGIQIAEDPRVQRTTKVVVQNAGEGKVFALFYFVKNGQNFVEKSLAEILPDGHLRKTVLAIDRTQ